ncbi:MAG: hypothetical protein KJ604_20490, partial [Gammaproteobacteria bacterium]|nr:hypothetical protein [Gammaproteobacteria bacterium]
LGIPFRGIVHDWSKFLPSEWGPYAEYFYGGPHIKWSEVGVYGKTYHFELCWKTCQEGAKESFNFSWLYHQHRNPHHWQYWVLREDDGNTFALPMPLKYRLELLADWHGAGIAITGKRNTREWYEKNKDKMLLHPETRAWIEATL